jgi:hypothetical protein
MSRRVKQKQGANMGNNKENQIEHRNEIKEQKKQRPSQLGDKVADGAALRQENKDLRNKLGEAERENERLTHLSRVGTSDLTRLAEENTKLFEEIERLQSRSMDRSSLGTGGWGSASGAGAGAGAGSKGSFQSRSNTNNCTRDELSVQENDQNEDPDGVTEELIFRIMELKQEMRELKLLNRHLQDGLERSKEDLRRRIDMDAHREDQYRQLLGQLKAEKMKAQSNGGTRNKVHKKMDHTKKKITRVIAETDEESSDSDGSISPQTSQRYGKSDTGESDSIVKLNALLSDLDNQKHNDRSSECENPEFFDKFRGGKDRASVQEDGLFAFLLQQEKKSNTFRQHRCEEEWDSDSTSSECSNCLNRFKLLRRRHHCRACGKLVCDPCSQKRAPHTVEGLNSTSRVCDPCFSLLVRLPEVERTMSCISCK